MKKERKIGLKKIYIQNLDNVMERDEQDQVRGGSKVTTIEPAGITSMPIFC